MRGNLTRPSFAHQWREYSHTAPGDTAKRIQKAHVVITNKTPLYAADIQNANHLELIAVAATGTDIIDLHTCRTANVAVCNVRHYANHSVSEHVLALIFCLSRGIVQHHQRTIAGEWTNSTVFSPNMGPITNVRGMKIGIIGGGALGQATATLAESVGMTATFLLRDTADSLPRLPLSPLLAQSDIISLHCPLTAQTRNLINADTLARMKPGAILINTARGGLVDSAALIHALTEGELGGAGIDVLPAEPPSIHEPLLARPLPNLIITPHVAWASEQSLKIFHAQLHDNIEQFYTGSPQNIL